MAISDASVFEVLCTVLLQKMTAELFVSFRYM